MQATLSVILSSALTQYDTKQSKSRYYNHYALGLYMQAATRCEELVNAGMPLDAALQRCFNDRVLTAVQKFVAKSTIISA